LFSFPGHPADRDAPGTTVPPAALTPADRILAGLIDKGHPREAIRLYLALLDAELLARVARLNLPAPADRPLRKPGGRNPWQLTEVHRLLDLWQQDVHGTVIAETIGRSPGGVRGKARRLGLYRRDRKALVREIPAAPPAPKPRHQIAWTEPMETELAERWFANEHHAAIARDMGIPEAAIRSKATRLGLPPRDREEIVDSYDPANAGDLQSRYIRRKCALTGKWFWGQRNGPRTSPVGLKSKQYRDLQSGLLGAYL
jgi:hypothetical protein